MTTWVLDTVDLPFGGPSSVQWGILRKQIANKIIEQFPFPVDIGPESFELQIKGQITSGVEIEKLRETVRRAEKETAQLEVLPTTDEFAIYTGKYAVGKAKIGQKGPQFDGATGKIVQDYDITLVQFAGGGTFNDGNSGDKVLDEDGVGFGDLNVLFEDILLDSFPNIFADFFN